MDVKNHHNHSCFSCTCFGCSQPKIELLTRRQSRHESTARRMRSPEKNPSPAQYEPFDICPVERSDVAEEGIKVKELDAKILRPGMVLLKHYLTTDEQVQIVKECRELGVGRGGFFQPTFRNRSKLHLQMMCLGLHWDHETRIYSESRSFDGVKPASIPFEFTSMVKRVMKSCHNLIEEINPECILPQLNPDVCIVNFYTTTGRLGLHQDRDESKTSLKRGLPVVSFSIGDSAKFLYGDTRNIDEAKEVELESGDVLIFGGESRLVFHGVSSIIPGSSPNSLLKETNLRPGRLNLTFRQCLVDSDSLRIQR